MATKKSTTPTKISELIPDDKNFNKGSEAGAKLIKKSFEKFGAGRSILLDKNNRIIAGNKSVEFSGIDDVQIVESDGTKLIAVKRTDIDLDSPLGREMALADNASAKANIVFDAELIEAEVGEAVAEEWGVEMPKVEPEVTEDDFDVDSVTETDIVLGDLFEIGEHRLLCGDSTCSDTVAKLMNGEKADMVFTDPPYNANYKSRGENELLRKGIKNDNMSNDDFEQFIKGFVSTCLLNIKDGASLYFCCNWKDSYPRFYFNLQEAGINISANIVWNKGSGGMGWQDYRYQYEFIIYGFKLGAKHSWYGGRTETDVWDIGRDNRTDYKHPTQKPIAIPTKAITNSSKSGDLVMKLFTGSGSTMVASHQLNRKCYGMELDPKYCQVIVDRMRKLDPNLTIKRNGVVI